METEDEFAREEGNFRSMGLGMQKVDSLLGSCLQRRGRGPSHPLPVSRPTLPAFSAPQGRRWF